MMATNRTASSCKVSCSVAVLLACASSQAFSSGFSLIEQSVSSMGTAYAGAGSNGQDASTIYFNPALMSRLEGDQVSVGLHLVSPSTRFSGGSTYNAANAAILNYQANGGTPIAGTPAGSQASGGDAGENGIVPHLAYVHNINGKWDFGLSVNTPFGLRTKYSDDWAGRYSAIESEIITVNINPALSYRLDAYTSVGFGVSAMYGKLKLRNAIDDALLIAIQTQTALGGAPDSSGQLNVDDWGYGFNFGVLLEPNDQTRLGFAYRSSVSLNLDGSFKNDSQFLSLDSHARVPVKLPDTLLLSAYHELNPEWAVMADLLWTGWSHIDALVAQLSDTGSTNTIPLRWEDSTRVAVGVSYKQSDRLTLRGGIAYDQTPVTDSKYRPAALPDEDRTWLSLGAGFRPSKQLSFDVAYAHLFVKDTSIHSTDAYSSAIPVGTGLHALDGTYKSSVDILSAQANWKF
jgi:long-chain fatty acid transport protein